MSAFARRRVKGKGVEGGDGSGGVKGSGARWVPRTSSRPYPRQLREYKQTKNADMQACRHENVHSCRHTFKQACKHVNQKRRRASLSTNPQSHVLWAEHDRNCIYCMYIQQQKKNLQTNRIGRLFAFVPPKITSLHPNTIQTAHDISTIMKIKIRILALNRLEPIDTTQNSILTQNIPKKVSNIFTKRFPSFLFLNKNQPGVT
jgi:hypothetical protein